jgi:hypothetical protein
MFRFRPKRPRVQIGEVKPTKDMKITKGLLYEITPESYAGPWELEPGTVLEVVSTPKKEKP